MYNSSKLMKTIHASPLWSLLLATILTTLGLTGSHAAQIFVGTNAPGGTTNFTFAINASGTNLALQIAGDAVSFSHLALRAGLAPTATDYDFIAQLNGTANAINLQLPELKVTNYFVQVRTPAGSAAHEFTLTLDTNRAGFRSETYPVLKKLPFTATGTLTPGTWHYFQMDVPAGLPGLRCVLSATGVGNPDLFMRREALPTEFSADRLSRDQSVDTLVFTDTESTAGTYFIGVFLPGSAAGSANYTLTTSIGYLTGLTWDPGTDHLGTQVFTNQSSSGGNHFFKITTQNPNVGAWRTALRVLGGEANLFLRQGSFSSDPAQYSHSSTRVGSDGFVLDASEFQAAQDWFLCVSDLPGASWTLLSGDVFVRNLGTLAADASSSSGAVEMGPEGMRYFRTATTVDTLGWRLWLNGAGNTLLVRKATVPLAANGLNELQQAAQMLVVPPYLSGGDSYFVGVPGNPGTTINLDSRKQAVADLDFSSVTNLAISGYGYVTFRVQVPIQQIAWLVSTRPTAGNPNVAIRRNVVPNEWENDAFSEVAGLAEDSVALVPPTLSDGTFFITVYGNAPYNGALENGNPVIRDVNYIGMATNGLINRVGWSYFRVTDIESQLGTLGWELFLQNQPPGTELALRRNAVPGRWSSRNGQGSTPGNVGFSDASDPNGYLQRPDHQADIWYIGAYQNATVLGPFVLHTRALTGSTIPFDIGTTNIVNQPAGRWNFFRVDVPADALGWEVRLRNVTSGDPKMVIRRDRLPNGVGTTLGGGNPHVQTTWPSGQQWAPYSDWTTLPNSATGVDENGRYFGVGMGSPLEPGTYYLGIINGSGSAAMTYTLESRGIGASYSIPVTPLNYSGAGSSVTVPSLAPRGTVYYRVTVPAGVASWKLRLNQTAGESLLLFRPDALPNIGTGRHPDNFGAVMQKDGPEQFLMLPQGPDTILPGGTYYLAVVSEGATPDRGQGRVGAANAGFTLQSLGAAPVVSLGTLGTPADAALTLTNSLAGGEGGIYQFTIPAGTLSFEAEIQSLTGSSVLSGRAGDLAAYDYDTYGLRGGYSPAFRTFTLATVANPATGTYTLFVKPQPTGTYTYPDSTFVLRVRAALPGLIAFDGGRTNIANHAPDTWRYFRVEVPAGVLGWDLRLTNVTAGSPQLIVRKALLPDTVGTMPWNYPFQSTAWPDEYQVAAYSDATGRNEDPDGTNTTGRVLTFALGQPLEVGTYFIGVFNSINAGISNPATYSLLSRGIGTNNAIRVPLLAFSGAGGSTNVTALAAREAAYFQVNIPAGNPGWKIKLTPTTGEALLVARKNFVPDLVTGFNPYYENRIRMQKTTNEHLIVAARNDPAELGPGTWFLAVVGEGRNPSANRVGTNTTSFTLTSQGNPVPVNLGTINPPGGADLLVTNSLEGGEGRLYTFSVPPGTTSFEVKLDHLTGVPGVSGIAGSGLPATVDNYGYIGGLDARPDSFQVFDSNRPDYLVTIANPAEGLHTLLVKAGYFGNDWPAASYVLRVRATQPTPLAFNNGSATITGQPARTWRYFQVDVPETALGWDIRLINVTSGKPQLIVRRGQLPGTLGTTPWQYPQYSASWPNGYQWGAGSDWSGRTYDPTGTEYEAGRILAMGMGNPLEFGTYYIGISGDGSDTNALSYQVLSRGIGGGLAIPVTDLGFSGGRITNSSLPAREAAYYRVIVPTNAPSWQVRLGMLTGEGLLMVQRDYLPSVATGGRGYAYTSAYKPGNEHYLLLPDNGASPAEVQPGAYYICVAGEGQSPAPSSIGTGSSQFVIESKGTLVVNNLFTLSGTDIVRTESLEGGAVKAYRFTLPAGTLGYEARLENIVGTPILSISPTNRFPTPGGSSYGSYGGDSYYLQGTTVPMPNAPAGTHTLLVRGDAGPQYLYPDSSYRLRLRLFNPPVLNFAANLNTNGNSHAVSALLADNQRVFYRVEVPATNNGLPVIGWKLSVTENSGRADIRVRRDALPDDVLGGGTSPFQTGNYIVAPPYLRPGTWYVEVKGSGATDFTLASSALTLERPAWVMPAAGQTGVAPGLVYPTFGDSGVSPTGTLPPDDGGTDLANDDYHFYAITVPPTNAGLLRVQLEAISGNPNLYGRVGLIPTRAHGPDLNLPQYGTSYDRALEQGTQTEYANWVPAEGRYESELPPGTWYLMVHGAGSSNVRYRLRLSVGFVQSLAFSGGTFTNQTAAGGDWRYFRVQVPTNPPTNWRVTFYQTLGDVMMYVRDTIPPGEPPLGIGGPVHWQTDNKNSGAQAPFDAPSTYDLPVPPLRPGSIYYLGFRALDDVTFAVSTSTNGPLINATNTIAFYGGFVSNTLAAGAARRYRIDVPADAARWRHQATNAIGVDLHVEQGTLPPVGGSGSHYYSYGRENDFFSQYLRAPNNWPWRPNIAYYLVITNTTGISQPFTFRLDGRNAATDDEDADGLPDAWEMFYFVYTYFYDGNSDPDGDGVSNRDEFLEGTNPNDATSFNPRLFITANAGSVSRNPNASFYTMGAVVNLTATPNPGFVFAGWSGDATGNANPLGVTMNTNKNIIARFTPPNDSFANRASLAGLNVLVANAHNTNATAEVGEPAHAGNAAQASVWWTWTAPNTGLVTVRTTDSTFDTTLAVYTGNAVNALTPVASDNNGDVAGTSRVTFFTLAGATYPIAVDSPSGQMGNIVLRLQLSNVALHLLSPVRVLPSRDFRLDLQSVSGGSYTVQYSTNLSNWFALTNLTLGTELISVIDTNSATIPRRFYRVLSP